MDTQRAQPKVVFLDRHLLVLDKPAGLPAQPDVTRDLSAVEWCADFLRTELDRTDWNPFVAPVHRLDRPVSGLLVLARTSKAADRLAAQFRTRSVHKAYLAVVQGNPSFDFVDVRLFLRKDEGDNRVEYRPQPFNGAKEALTSVQVVCRGPDQALMAMLPHTGRSHQLRAAASFLGHPILGDLKYGAPEGFGHWLALHAHALRFDHPVRRVPLVFRSAPPEPWHRSFPWLERCIRSS
ncbi:MAG: RluA family pseudouridine synthase [Deltaproteobacteria bacterium]|nr:RluA family pseudouridine synthase [Deltaproteobacteria bacterium]